MKKQWSALLVAAFLSLLCAATTVSAQASYDIFNDYLYGGVPTGVVIHTTCGKTNVTVGVGPGYISSIPLQPGCSVLGVDANGMHYPVWSSGWALPGTSPTMWITVTGTGVMFF